jgi:hypothetical protein
LTYQKKKSNGPDGKKPICEVDNVCISCNGEVIDSAEAQILLMNSEELVLKGGAVYDWRVKPTTMAKWRVKEGEVVVLSKSSKMDTQLAVPRQEAESVVFQEGGSTRPQSNCSDDDNKWASHNVEAHFMR